MDGPAPLFDRLVELSWSAHADGMYEAAYHALAAALHVAETRRDEPQLQAVEALAREQLSRIDALAPENRMSSAAAERRRGVNLYAGLARQAATQARVVRVRRQLSRRRPEERPA